MKQRAGSKASVKGFTLIELLIVVFIIGLIAASIALSMDTAQEDSDARKEAQDLLRAIEFVGEFATLNNELVGLFVSVKESEESGQKRWCYHWQRFRDGQWGDLPEDTLVPHCMADSLQWDLVVEGKIYVYDPELERHPPVVLFSPSGETTPVEMAIFEHGSTAEAQRLELDLMGNSHWRNREEEERRRDR